MIIDIKNIDKERFNVKDGLFCGQKSYLVTPSCGIKFKKKEEIFRSSIWSDEGELLSAGFKKFCNYQENNEYPSPDSLLGTSIVNKEDGSLLCVNKHNGILNCRTRGSFGISHLLNGYEIDVLKDKYPFAFDNPILNEEHCTFLFEWVSPDNVIVLKYPEPDIYFLNIVNHSNYSYFAQDDLDVIAQEYELKRPIRYKFEDLESLIKNIEIWDNREGVCLYHKNNNDITKIKASRYLLIHSLKSDLNNKEKLIDLYLQSNTTNYNDFFNYISINIDYEVAKHFQGQISEICDARKKVDKILDHMDNFVLNLKGMSRKQQAEKIISSYGKGNNRASFVFQKLDNKKLDNNQLKKLYFQTMK